MFSSLSRLNPLTPRGSPDSSPTTPRDVLVSLRAPQLSEDDLHGLLSNAKANTLIQKVLVSQGAIPLVVERLTNTGLSEAVVIILLELIFVITETDQEAREKLNTHSEFSALLTKLKDQFGTTPFLVSWSKVWTICSQYSQYYELLSSPESVKYFAETLKSEEKSLTLNTIKILENMCHLHPDSALLTEFNLLEDVVSGLSNKSSKIRTAILHLLLVVSRNSESSKLCLTAAIGPLMNLIKGKDESAKRLALDIAAHLVSHVGLRILLEEEGLVNIAQLLLNSEDSAVVKSAKSVLVEIGVLQDDTADAGVISGSGGLIRGAGAILSGSSKILEGAYSTVQNVSTAVVTIGNGAYPTQSVAGLIEVLRQAPQSTKIKLAQLLLKTVEVDASVLASPILITSVMEIALLSLSNVKAVIMNILYKVAMYSSEIAKCMIPYMSYVFELLTNAETQVATVEAIWALAFNPEFKDTVQNDKQIMSSLEELAKSPDQNVAKNACGALFTITTLSAQQVSNSTPSTSGHVMLSYSWSAQPLIQSIHKGLAERGYNVWIDLEQMAGSTLEAMAHAVEDSEVVFICYSSKYVASVACRTEAEYAYKLQKSIIPIKVEKDFTPTGWLGAMLGTKLYHEIVDTEDLDIKLSKIIKDLGARGKSNGTTVPTPVSNGITSKRTPLEKWTQEDVSKWLTQIELDSYISTFETNDISGRALKEIQYIYKELKSDNVVQLLAPLKMSLGHYLCFMNELRKLS